MYALLVYSYWREENQLPNTWAAIKKRKKEKDSFLVKAQENMKRNEREKKTQTDYAVNFSCHNVLQR